MAINWRRWWFIRPPLLLLAIFLLAILFFESYYQQRFYPGVKLAGLDLGGRDYGQAETVLRQHLAKLPSSWCFRWQKNSWCFANAGFGFAYQLRSSLDRAWQLGRQGSWPQRFWKQLRLWRRPRDLDLAYQINRPDFEQKLALIAADLRQPAIPPTLKVSGQTVEVEKGRRGRELDRQRLEEEVKMALRRGRLPKAFVLPVKATGRFYPPEQLATARQRALKLLSKTMVLQSERGTFVISGRELVRLVGFGQDWSPPGIDDYLKAIAVDVEAPARDALFQFKRGRVVAFRPAQIGWRLPRAPAREAMIGCLQQLAAGKSHCLVDLKLVKVMPKITTANSNRLGIRELVAEGKSYFHGSSLNRIHNLSLASQRLNGMLIAPGETFSFNKAVGEISAATGFKSAYIIQNGRTILGDGGGVCQVSTTLFRALLHAGLPIVERHAHAYRVHYYEEKSPLGLDATVFAPSVDLKFKNDYSSYLLIQTKVDARQASLLFQIYGSRDGRRVSISPTRSWDWRPAPPPRYQDDPTLPPGAVKQVDWAAAGIKVAVDWVVRRQGKILRQQTFFSNYRPWRAVFLRGPR